MQLIGEVRTVLAHNCYKCHSGAKTEGELRLDEREFVFQGGESGAIISPGNPDESELFAGSTCQKPQGCHAFQRKAFEQGGN
jgi:hypothetical protein